MALYTDLNIELTDEQIAIKEETHKFAKEVLRPASLELDKISDPDEMANSKLYWDTMKKTLCRCIEEKLFRYKKLMNLQLETEIYP